VFWKSRTVEVVHAIWNFMTFFVVIVVIFIFCYWRILVVIRHQAKVMAAHSATESTSAHARSYQVRVNVIKTMIFVSAFYVICWMPVCVFYLVLNVAANLTLNESAYFAVMFVSFFYIIANPFIYVVKLEPVRRSLLRLAACKTQAVGFETST